MTSVAVRAWLVSLAALALGGAGLTSLAAGSTVTSLTRMAVAAAVLSAYTALVGLVVTPRADRTWTRCLRWGGLVPGVIAITTAALVASRSDLGHGILSGLPWVLGALVVCLLGPRLPAVPLPRWRRGRT